MLKKFSPPFCKRLWINSTIIAALCVLGCREQPKPLPTTYPVSGVVSDESGKPVAGGVVRFQPMAEPSVTTSGVIGKDGTYSLNTIRDGLKSEGAVPGPNRVLLFVTLSSGGVVTKNYPELYNVQSSENVINFSTRK